MPTLTYLQALTAMEYLLSQVDENIWRDSIRIDIHRWLNSQDTESHLRSYGGMGSFNDVIICQENGHRVSRIQTPWVNTLFCCLKSLCYQAAKKPLHELNLEDVFSPDRSLQEKITGERCLQCGYGEVSPYGIEGYLSRIHVPKILLNGSENLNTWVDKILKTEIDSIVKSREEVSSKLVRSGVAVHPEGRNLRPCPHCGSNDTAVYRWGLTADGLRYVPSDDNLALRKK